MPLASASALLILGARGGTSVFSLEARRAGTAPLPVACPVGRAIVPV
jgi:hypothetical protein